VQAFLNQPAYQTSLYLYLLPFELAIMTLGKAISQTTFRPVFLILTLIILCDMSTLVYSSVYECVPDSQKSQYGWGWFLVVYEGSQLQNYILFVYWYVWYHVFSQKQRETELLMLFECGEFHGDAVKKTRQFQQQVIEVMAKQKAQKKRSFIFFYSCLTISILNDLVQAKMILQNVMYIESVMRTSLYSTSILVTLFLGTMCLVTFYKLIKVMKVNDKVAIPQRAIYANCFTVVCMMVFSMETSNTSGQIDWYSVGANIASLFVQLLMITFCWRISVQQTTN
jgi:hypothetical protein